MSRWHCSEIICNQQRRENRSTRVNISNRCTVYIGLLYGVNVMGGLRYWLSFHKHAISYRHVHFTRHLIPFPPSSSQLTDLSTSIATQRLKLPVVRDARLLRSSRITANLRVRSLESRQRFPGWIILRADLTVEARVWSITIEPSLLEILTLGL